MPMQYDVKLRSLKELIARSALFPADRQYTLLQQVLVQILTALSAEENYELSRSVRMELESIFDTNPTVCTVSLVHWVVLKFGDFLGLEVNLDNYVVKSFVSDDEADAALNLFRSEVAKWKKTLVFSEPILPIDSVSPEAAEKLFGYINSILLNPTLYRERSEKNLNLIVNNIKFGESLARRFDRPDVFYFLASTTFDRMNDIYDFQRIRDLSENLFFYSLTSGELRYGFFQWSSTFSRQKNLPGAILYLALSILAFDRSRSNSALVRRAIIATLLRSLRDLNLIQFISPILAKVAGDPHISETEKHNFVHIGLTASISRGDPTTILRTYSYISSNLESILQNARHGMPPWLSAIYALEKQFAGNANLELLSEYKQLFERVVDKEDVAFLRAAYFDEDLDVEFLMREFIKSHATRSKADLHHEIERLVTLARRLAIKSAEAGKIDDYLVAMSFLTDFAQDGNIKARLENAHFSVTSEAEFAEVRDAILRNIPALKAAVKDCNANALGILNANESLIVAKVGPELGEFCVSNAWTNDRLVAFLKKLHELMRFDEQVSRRGRNLPYDEDMQKHDYEQLVENLEFARLPTNLEQAATIFMDLGIASFPHNLFLQSNGKLVAEEVAVSGSFDLLNSAKSLRPLQIEGMTTSLWTPVLADDLRLNLAKSRLDRKLLESFARVDEELVPRAPLSSDINIVMAHGGESIHDFTAFFANDQTAVIDLDAIFGPGKIAILFVCHGGKSAPDPFGHRLASVVTKLFARGYDGVIAPRWSLHISIPALWLPKFIEELRFGNTVGIAHYRANEFVRSQNLNPAGWACLHLYGNQFVKFRV